MMSDQELREIAKVTAVEQGAFLLQVMKSPFRLHLDARRDETPMDGLVATNITEKLERESGFPVYTEESEKEEDGRIIAREREETHWWVDSIDGTRRIQQNLPDWAVSIGLQREGVAYVGALCAPAYNKIFTAIQGKGAWVENIDSLDDAPKPISVSDLQGSDRRALVGTTDTETMRDTYRAMGVRHGLDNIVGSLALKIAMIAKGSSDIYLKYGAKANAWDLCAVEVIVHEAGGYLTDLKGDPFRYDQPDPVFRNGLLSSNEKELAEHKKLCHLARELAPEKYRK